MIRSRAGLLVTIGVWVRSCSSMTSLRVRVRYTTVARIAGGKIALVAAVPTPRPRSVNGDANQSPRFAPSGRVRMYASQKDSTAFAPSRQQHRRTRSPTGELQRPVTNRCTQGEGDQNCEPIEQLSWPRDDAVDR